ncbi:MAG: acyl-CoA thioesterase [Balneolaceae bacterium]
MNTYDYEIGLSVRDYELDVQGVVNNAVYQNYLEHARHEFLKEIGLNFVELHNNGTDAVVHKIELEYKQSLAANDDFIIRMKAEPSGNVRFVFTQNIYRKSDNALILKGKVTAVFMNNGRPIRPPKEVTNAIESYRMSS